MNEGLRDASLNILHQLLDEENIVLGQLTYVVEHLHNPLLEGCKPVSAKQREEILAKESDASKPPPLLTFAQHWELFANIATLHGAQAFIVARLEAAVNQRIHILEEHEAAKPVMKTNDAQAQSLKGGNNVTDMVSLESMTELFTSAAMRHYMAEHMMYSLNYSRNIAPRVLELWRLWRCRQEKNAGGVSLSSEERQRLACYIRFLHFLWFVMGREDGVPKESSVVFTCLPDMLHPRSSVHESSQATDIAPDGKAAISSAFTASAAMMQADPPIPANWRGFETLLVLLSTPLASLRRYMHVARCLIESGCLGKSMRRHLQSEFVDVVALRVAEEGSVVLDELTKQDISHIMARIDEVSVTVSSGLDEKKFSCIRPDVNGNRTLVHYGRLTKRYRRGRHDRLVFLFSDWLCYVEELANGRMRLCASISLDGLKVVVPENTMDTTNRFDILAREKRVTFFAPTCEQKQQWVEALRNTVMTYEKRVQRSSSLHQQHTGGVVRSMRATAPPLSHRSRLRRLQRADRTWQDELEKHAPRTTVLKAPPSAETLVTTSPLVLNDSAIERQSPLMNFDVITWADHSGETMHKCVHSPSLLPEVWTVQSPPGAHCGEEDFTTADADDIEEHAIVKLLPQSSDELPLKPMRQLFLDHFHDPNGMLQAENLSDREDGNRGTVVCPPTTFSPAAKREEECSWLPMRSEAPGACDNSENWNTLNGEKNVEQKSVFLPMAEVTVVDECDNCHDSDSSFLSHIGDVNISRSGDNSPSGSPCIG